MIYSMAAQEHFEQPRNVGRLKEATVVGQEGVPGQGNYMVLYLELVDAAAHGSDNGSIDVAAEAPIGDIYIRSARFQTWGCPAAIACGSWVSEWSVGKSVAEALQLDPDQVIQGLGGLPLGREHCAHLAVNALRNGLSRINSGDNHRCEV